MRFESGRRSRGPRARAALVLMSLPMLAPLPAVSAADPLKVFRLEGAQVAPPAATSASGEATLVLKGRQLEVSARWSGLSGPPTRIEIRGPAARGRTGSRMHVLGRGCVLGAADSVRATFEIPQARKKIFRDELAYVVVKTARFPRGELRGQVVVTEEEASEDD